MAASPILPKLVGQRVKRREYPRLIQGLGTYVDDVKIVGSLDEVRRLGSLGAKGVGEAGTLGSTPSIVSAAVDALSQFGVTHIDMMLRPEKLSHIINGGQS